MKFSPLILLGGLALGLLLLSSNKSSQSPASYVANSPAPSTYSQPYGGSDSGMSPSVSYGFDLSPDSFFGNDLQNYKSYQSSKDAEQENAILYLAQQLEGAYAQGLFKEDSPLSPAFDSFNPTTYFASTKGTTVETKQLSSKKGKKSFAKITTGPLSKSVSVFVEAPKEAQGYSKAKAVSLGLI